jgi:hypothetical protein
MIKGIESTGITAAVILVESHRTSGSGSVSGSGSIPVVFQCTDLAECLEMPSTNMS